MRISDWSSDVCSSDLQEEPANMGAWSWLDRRLETLARTCGVRQPSVGYRGRLESASPAGSFHELHSAHQAEIVASRSDERRVGKECVSTCRSRWSPDH